MSIKILGYNGPSLRRIVVAAKIYDIPLTVQEVEMGVDNETVQFRENAHPCQRVPVADLGADGYIFESNAIFRHILRLAAKNGKNSYGRSLLESTQVDQWIEFAANELAANSAGIYYIIMKYSPLPESMIEHYMGKLHEAFVGLECWLENRTFLVGERLTGADIAVATTLELALSMLPKSYELWKYKNVVRYYQTIFYASPGYAVGQKENGGDGFPVTKPAEPAKPKAETQKKDDKPKKEAADEDDDAHDDVPAPPKKVNPLDLLPPSPMVLDAFKREYSNNKDIRNGVTKYLWDNFDPEGYQMWFCKYKYNDELTKTFMTSNLVRGWFQRMEGNRKYAFGIALTTGTEESHAINAFWLIRKDASGDLPESVKDVEDTILFNWTKIDHTSAADKAVIADFLCWEGTETNANAAIGVPVLEGRCFK